MCAARLLVLACSICLAFSARLSAGFLIDSWETPQSVSIDGIIVGSEGGTLTGAGIYGDGRGYSLGTLNTAVSMTADAGRINLVVNPYANPFEGRFQLNYIDSTPSDNLTVMGAFGIELRDIVSNSNWNVAITLTGSPTSSVTSLTTTIPVSASSDLLIPFSSFSAPISGLGAISEIQFVFTGSDGLAPQLSIGHITFVAVPEPSTFLLIGLGHSLLLLRKRKLAIE